MSISLKLRLSIDAINAFIYSKSRGDRRYLKVSESEDSFLVTEKIDERSALFEIVSVIQSCAQELICYKAKHEIRKFSQSIQSLKEIIHQESLLGDSERFFEGSSIAFDSSFSKLCAIEQELICIGSRSKILPFIKTIFTNCLRGTKNNGSFISKQADDFEIVGQTVQIKTIPSKQLLENLKAYPGIKCFDFSLIKAPLLDTHLLSLKEELSYFKQVVKVDLHGKNKITGQCLEALKNLTALRQLDLSGCLNLDIAYASLFKSLSGLTHLNLANCSQITDGFLKEISHLKLVENLDLTSCYRITKEGIEALIPLNESIKILSLHLCESIESEGLENLKCFKNLKKLDIGYCRVTDDVVKEVSQLKHLMHLDLTCASRIMQEGFDFITKLYNLKGLTLFGCSNLSDIDLVKIAQLKNLVFLDLGLCSKISDLGLEAIKGLKGLKHLKLYGCLHITDRGLGIIATFYNITDLDLSFLEQISDRGLLYLKSLNKLSTIALTYCEEISIDAKNTLKLLKPKLTIS